ncbi:AraC family transcriptional regulator [Flammeovirgaceae bacterium SG7u.111]|nr:AraC family transcriptional regulator [Flammeovirgaceae bacterium SG7u.132]WPO33837.1 AraC family transcriptional regulator [Flammeovirgaceae bacterium SG7u.111]
MKPELEAIRLGKRNSILVFEYSNDHFDAPWHFHPQYELTYILESSGTKFIGDFVGPYEKGELVLLRSNLPHCWKSHREENTASRSMVVQWNKGIFAKVPEMETLFDMFRKASRGIIFEGEHVGKFIPKLIELDHLSGYELYVKLLELLLNLTEIPSKTLSDASFLDDLPNEYGDRMGKIHDFVETEYHRKIQVKELADLVNMSEQSFSRFFSKMMGRPFFTFLNEYRINMAAKMLIDTDRSVSQVGFACGYESLPFFHKQFNKFKQETPHKYRKKYGYVARYKQ